MKKALLIFSLLLLGAGCAKSDAAITTFEECVAAGNPVMESYPRQCRANGQSFVEQVAVPPSGEEKPVFNAELGEAFTLQPGQSRSVDGGLRVTLLAINDSRCKPDVQCIWAGELSATLKLEGPEETAPTQEITLGTVRAKTAEASGYRFALKDLSESFLTLTITR